MTIPAGGPSRQFEELRRPATKLSKAASERSLRAGRQQPIIGSLDSPPYSGLHGCVDGLDARGVRGWLVDAKEPARTQTVRVLLDGVQIMEARADAARVDVAVALGTQARPGFKLRWSQVRPLGPLRPVHLRKGELKVCAADGRALPCLQPSVDLALYDWIEPHVDRLTYVLGTAQVSPPLLQSDEELLEVYFDSGFYLAMYPQAAETPRDALVHYLHVGFAENFDPHPDFSSRYYLESNPDVREARMNPFLHYLRTGWFEGRMPRAPGGHKAEALARLVPLSETVRSWRRTDSARVLSSSALLTQLREILKDTEVRQLTVAFSHDDYTKNVGGVQLCLALEEKAIRALGGAYLHLSPWQALPTLYSGRQPNSLVLRVICNGSLVGFAEAAQVVPALQDLVRRLPTAETHLVVHALHGHAPEVVTAVHHALQPRMSYFWLHDFFSLCTGYNLLRNQVSYCGAPPQDSPACSMCVYGPARDPQLRRLQVLFEAVPFTAVAPSSHTAELWQARSPLPVKKVIVHPHCEPLEEGHRIAAASLDTAEPDAEEEVLDGAPIRVAYLGHPTQHKGWPVFRELVRQTCGNGRYEFWHLGMQPDPALPVRFALVQVSPEEPEAMVRAIEEANIDVVVQWSQWPETFGIAARESVAAGALMVVSRVSGAVADFVDSTNAGLVFDEESQLMEAFRGNLVSDRVAARRRQGAPVGRLVWSRLTADLIDTQE